VSRAVKQSTRDEYVRRILCAQEMVAQNLDEVPKPKDVAKHAGFSTHHFHRIFKGIVGESLMVFVRRLRLERAARQLRSSDRSVTEIAFDAQYNSASFPTIQRSRPLKSCAIWLASKETKQTSCQRGPLDKHVCSGAATPLPRTLEVTRAFMKPICV